MEMYACKYCGCVTDRKICCECSRKRKQIRQIKEMLMPTYKLKKELEKTEDSYFRYLWFLK